LRRVFICTEVSFPRGGATSNYIEYLSLALTSGGYSPIVIGQGKNTEDDLQNFNNRYIYNGIEYYNYSSKVNQSKFKIKRFIDANFHQGKQIVNLLKKYQLTSEDYIIFYTTNCFTINQVLSFAKQQGTMASMCITEHHRKSQFDNRLLYWRYKYSFNYSIAKTKSVIPISRYLEKIFKDKDCNTLLLPIMANPYEFSYDIKINKNKINFIYSGASFTKDSFETMLCSFLLLTKEEKENVCFHLTGVKRENLVKYLGGKKKILDQLELENVINIHPWLEYRELIELMKEMDYLFIARETNQTTVANFPSKVPELMCYGVVPLVSRVGDYTDIYLSDGKDSIIFDGCSPEIGVKALRRAIHMSAESRITMRKNARETAEEKFFYGNWSNKIIDFIEKCRTESIN